MSPFKLGFSIIAFFFISLQVLAQESTGSKETRDKSSTDQKKRDEKNAILKEGSTDEARAEALKRLVPNLTALREELDRIEKDHGLDLGGDPSEEDKDEKLKYHWRISSEDGWTLGLDFGIITDWDVTHSITGVEPGMHFKLGGVFAFIATLGSGPHEWRNKVSFIETFAKKPYIDPIVKSRDDFEIEMAYLWWPADWAGLSSEIRMDTSIFPGYDFEERPSHFFVVDQFGNPLRNYPNQTSLLVNTWFLPLHFKQMLTGHVRPIMIPEFAMEIKAGGYIIETIADGMLHFESRNGDNITLKQLTNYVHLGPFIGLDIFGKLAQFLNIEYHLSADFGYATFNTHQVSLTPTFTDDLHFEGELNVTVNPFKSIAVTFDLEAKYDPSHSPDLQFTQKIFLNLPVEL